MTKYRKLILPIEGHRIDIHSMAPSWCPITSSPISKAMGGADITPVMRGRRCGGREGYGGKVASNG